MQLSTCIIWCRCLGVWRDFSDITSLKEEMSAYYDVLAAKIVPKPTSCPPVSWSELYEDGQGIGPTTSACVPAYNREVSPPRVMGVFCVGYSLVHLMSLTGWRAEWQDIEAGNRQCQRGAPPWRRCPAIFTPRLRYMNSITSMADLLWVFLKVLHTPGMFPHTESVKWCEW